MSICCYSVGRRVDLTGGGLIRSLGGWLRVLSLRAKAVEEYLISKGVSADRLEEAFLFMILMAKNLFLSYP
jgi:hypothetical protein